MSQLLQKPIRKSTIPRMRRRSTPTTSPNFYSDASRDWIPRKLGTHSEAHSTTSTRFLPSWNVMVDFLHIFLLLRLQFFGTSTLIFIVYSMHSNLFFSWSHFVHYVEDFLIFFYAFSNISPLGHLQFWYPSPTLFCSLYLHHWSPPRLSTFRETLLWDILVWESKIPATQLFSIACFICWNGSHFCLWGGSWR